MSAPMTSQSEAIGLIHAPNQLALTLPPGQRTPGRKPKVWRVWTADEQLQIEMDDTIGSYSTGRLVEAGL